MQNMNLTAAVEQLARSERRQSVLQNFLKLLEEAGLGMDSSNQRALLALAFHVSDGNAVGVRDEIQEWGITLPATR